MWMGERGRRLGHVGSRDRGHDVDLSFEAMAKSQIRARQCRGETEAEHFLYHPRSDCHAYASPGALLMPAVRDVGLGVEASQCGQEQWRGEEDDEERGGAPPNLARVESLKSEYEVPTSAFPPGRCHRCQWGAPSLSTPARPLSANHRPSHRRPHPSPALVACRPHFAWRLDSNGSNSGKVPLQLTNSPTLGPPIRLSICQKRCRRPRHLLALPAFLGSGSPNVCLANNRRPANCVVEASATASLTLPTKVASWHRYRSGSHSTLTQLRLLNHPR